MREASIAIRGRVAISVVQKLVQEVTAVDDPDVDLVVDVNSPHIGAYSSDDGSVFFWGKDIEADVKAVARAIIGHYPAARLSVLDDFGNDVDYLSDVPHPRPRTPKQQRETRAVPLDLPTPLFRRVEKAAARNGATVPE